MENKKEDIKISIADFTKSGKPVADAGQIASRIYRSLKEDKEVNISYVFTHNSASSDKLVLKAEKADRILGRMLKENNDRDRTKDRIVRSLPESEKVNSSDIDPETGKNKKLLVIKVTYYLIKG